MDSERKATRHTSKVSSSCLWMKVSIAVFLAVILIGLTVSSEYMLHYALQPEMGAYVEQERIDNFRNDYSFGAPWIDSILAAGGLRDTFIVNRKGERLHGYYIYADSVTDKTAVLVHGYTDCALKMLFIGYLYHHDLGFNLLLPDLHYHGLSEGKYVQMGWLDRLDVLEWIKLADNLFGGNAQMVVHGISMGAATTMMLSGEDVPECVRCYVEDCGYTSVWDEFAGEVRNQFHLPSFPLLYAASALCKVQLGWSFGEASSLSQVRKCYRPMLFIHGEQDDYVPTEMVYRLYEAKPQSKALWIAPGSPHAWSYHDHPAEYTRQVRQFLSRYLDNFQVRETSLMD